jgi:ArsR family transcriptional regulator
MPQLLTATPPIVASGPELLAKFFRGLGDPTRVKILRLLMEGDKNVTELVDLLGVPQGRASSHLACLKWCGFAVSYRNGRNVYYTLADPRVRQIMELGQETLTQNAERILACQEIK